MDLPATCPEASGHWIDRRTGERRPRTCGRLRCPRCGPRLALSTANAIVLAAPTRAAVLTLRLPWPSAPRAVFDAFLGGVRGIAEGLRAEGLVFEYAWTVELSSRSVPNAHVLCWGSEVTPARFLSEARRAGMAWGSIQPITHLPRLARYVLKLPLSPLDLGTDGARAMALHLDLNAGRLLHSSRGFWRGPEGAPLPGVRVARIEARRRGGQARPRPTAEELVEWRRGWDLPRLDGESEGPRGR